MPPLQMPMPGMMGTGMPGMMPPNPMLGPVPPLPPPKPKPKPKKKKAKSKAKAKPRKTIKKKPSNIMPKGGLM